MTRCGFVYAEGCFQGANQLIVIMHKVFSVLDFTFPKPSPLVILVLVVAVPTKSQNP
jgi:hypothetical protein